MNFDYANDIHQDFYVPHDGNIQKYEDKTIKFAHSLIPKEPSENLLIGGDSGHYNIQNFFFIRELSKVYKRIFIVFGNHDYYLVSQGQAKKYKKSSFNRKEEMKQMYGELSNVYVLEGDVIEVDGVRIGGTGMWYDFSYGQKEHGLSYDDIYQIWWANSNDSRLIRGVPSPFDIFNQEIDRLKKIITESDIIMTHVGPDWSLYQPDIDYSKHYNYYFFDGKPFFQDIQDKMWLFGHIHYDLDTIKYGCRFISNAIGYPDENGLYKKFKQFHFQKTLN